MTTLELLRARITGVEDLRSVVRTLKSLSAVQMRQYQRVSQSLLEQAATIELGFQALFRERAVPPSAAVPRREQQLAAIVMGSDQGLCGAFDEQVVELALEQLGRARGPSLVVVGGRAAERLSAAGLALEATLAVPNSLAGVGALVEQLLGFVDAWSASARVERVLVLHQRRKSAAASRPRRFQLAPIPRRWLRAVSERRWPARGLPTHSLDDERLLAALARAFFWGSLYRASVESLEAESAERWNAMQAAERNIDERLEELQAAFREQRQGAITDELLDIVVGSAAVFADATRARRRRR